MVFDVYSCKATMDYEEVICTPSGAKQLEVRIPDDFYEEHELKPRSNMEIIIDIDALQLPYSTLPTLQPVVETYEQLINEDEEEIMSKIDSNLDKRITVDLGLTPSEFTGVSIER